MNPDSVDANANFPAAAASGGWKALWAASRPASRSSPARAEARALAASVAPSITGPSLVQQTLKRLGPLFIGGEAVVRLLKDPGKQPEPVVAAIELCPGLSARLISVINSAAFGESWRTSSVARAVQLLGPRRARAIVLAYALRNATRTVTLDGQTLDAYRFASLHKACAARLFCRAVSPACADVAYSLALVQDLGMPMLLAADPQFYDLQVIPAGTEGWMERERRQFGLTHAAVGQELLLSWHASDKLQQLVLGHHKPPPLDAAPEDLPLLWALHLASLLPHLGETIDPSSQQALQEIHERLLSPHYETADAFLLAAATEVRSILAAHPRTMLDPYVLNKLVAAVTGEAINNTTRLAKAEQAYHGQRQTFTNLREQAFTDALTRLLNRRGFLELAERRIQSELQCGRGLCCMAFDLDGLKKINDTYGHEVGDQFLRGFAKLLRRYFDEDDLIARFGGDEYAALIADVDEPTARKVAERINGQLHRSRLRLRPDLEIEVSCSIGAVFYDRAAGVIDIENVISQADHVMYQRKHSGKAGMVFEVYAPTKPLDAGDSRMG